MIQSLGTTPRMIVPARVLAFRGKRADAVQNLAPKTDAQKEKTPPSLPGLIIGTFLTCLPGAIAEYGFKGLYRGGKKTLDFVQACLHAVFA